MAILKRSLFCPALFFTVFLIPSLGLCETFKGKVVQVRGKDVTIKLESQVSVSKGDSVDLSYSVYGEVIGAGTWKVSAVKSDGTVEATPVDPLVAPQPNFDAVIHASGTRAITKGSSDPAISEKPELYTSADERFEYALQLYEGRGVEQDKTRAINLLKQGVDENHPSSLRAYGWLFEQGADGFPKDDYQAYNWYTKAADGGDQQANYLLGKMYEEGRGVGKDVSIAVSYFEKACNEESGFTGSSCGKAGYLYEIGINGQQDYKQAIYYYDKGCTAGSGTSCLNLARKYERGLGVPEDRAKAAELFKKSCELESKEGCAGVGWTTYMGIGVPKDEEQGLKLLRKGCDDGIGWSCAELEKIDSRDAKAD